jgi:hypothetical protein
MDEFAINVRNVGVDVHRLATAGTRGAPPSGATDGTGSASPR